MSRRGESIYKRADGRWEARYIHHYEDGRAVYRYLYAASYQEVKEKRLSELMHTQAAPHTPPPCPPMQENSPSVIKGECSIKFKELAALWLAERRARVKESTYVRYARTLEKYLLPVFGELALPEPSCHALNIYFSHLSQEGGLRGKPLAPKTLSDMRCVVKSIYKYGNQNGIPCPSLQTLQAVPKAAKKAVILTVENRRRIEEQLLHVDTTTQLGILLALYTGLRIGEICGLRWGDIDLDGGTVSVRRTVERIADIDPSSPRRTKVIVSEPKTANASRTIPLPTFLTEQLRPFAVSEDCYLLTGTPLHTEPHQYYLRYKTFLRQLGLEHYTFHALRHTFATRCVEAGFDVKSLSEILGHANVSTTLAIYVHPTLEQKRAQMERLTLG